MNINSIVASKKTSIFEREEADNVSATSSFLTNANNKFYAFYEVKCGLLKKL